MLRRCLARDPNKRLRDAGDARLELEQAIEDPDVEALGLVEATDVPAAQPSPAMRRLPWAVAAVAIAGLLATLFLGGGEVDRSDGISRHFTVPVPGTTIFDNNEGAPPTVSPDGRWIVYGMIDDQGTHQLWLRPVDSFQAQPLAGTENGSFPFWSPDSKHVGFFYQGRVKRFEVATGRIQTVVDAGSAMPRGASWGTNDLIAYVPHSNTGVWVVQASGGEPRQVTTPDPQIVDGSHRWPNFLSDGEHFLFLLWTNDTEALEEHGGVYVASVSGKDPPVRLLPETSSMKYAPSGHVLVLQETNLLAVPFDANALEIRGEGTIVTDGVLRNSNNGFAAFSVSGEGTLVFARDIGAIPNTSFKWADRNGDVTQTPVEPAPMFDYLELSPDGTRAAVLMPGSTGDEEVWVVDLVRGVRTRLVTPAPWGYHDPVWSEDGRQVLYVSTEAGSWDFYIRNADGSGSQQPFLVDARDKVPYDIHDGRVLLWSARDGGATTQTHLYDPDTGESTIVQENAPAIRAQFSPQGRFFTYHQIESGRREVFVEAIESGARWQVSTSGGNSPRWSDDGREIIYADPEGHIVAVAVTIGDDGVTLDRPVELFRIDASVVAWDATGDHRRFLLAERPQRASEPLHVILDWNAGL
jgi:Tol biopolymer transport system component